MAITFPASPSTDDKFVAGGKLWAWSGLVWARSRAHAVIEGGSATTVITDDALTIDGGSA